MSKDNKNRRQEEIQKVQADFNRVKSSIDVNPEVRNKSDEYIQSCLLQKLKLINLEPYMLEKK